MGSEVPISRRMDFVWELVEGRLVYQILLRDRGRVLGSSDSIKDAVSQCAHAPTHASKGVAEASRTRLTKGHGLIRYPTREIILLC